MQIDMSKEFLIIMQKFLMHILFGTDIDSTRLTVRMRPHKNTSFKSEDCSLSQGVEATFQQVFDCLPARLTNPIWNALYKFTG